MTIQQQLHEQAELAQLAPVDLDAVTRAGGRAVRRRRWVAGAASLATVLVVGGVATLARPEAAGPEPADPTPPVVPGTTALSWASGSVLHTLDGDLDLGHPVTAYARTELGFLVADDASISSVVAGREIVVGTRSRVPGLPGLVADSDGWLAAWQDGRDVLAIDQRTGEVRGFPLTGTGAITAVDGSTVYVTDGRGAVAIDTATGAEEVLAPRGAAYPIAHEDGLAALRDRRGAVLVEGRTVREPGPETGTQAAFSPDATWLAIGDSGSVGVVESRTGVPRPLELGPQPAQLVEWLDHDSLSVLVTGSPTAGSRLLKCHVATGACEVAVAGLPEEFQVPSGLTYLFLVRG